MMAAPSSVPIAAQEWRARGACRDRDMAQFYSAAREGRVAARLRVARAKSVCAQCPVRPECAAQALTTREEHGVWGGFTSVERSRLLALGWTDLVDRRRGLVDVAGLERRLARRSSDPVGGSASELA
jgi:WhiB family redox-sensing transcriptional regulator